LFPASAERGGFILKEEDCCTDKVIYGINWGNAGLKRQVGVQTKGESEQSRRAEMINMLDNEDAASELCAELFRRHMPSYRHASMLSLIY
jgi:hypothetical protein